MTKGHWLREAVETIVIALILAMLIQTFLVASIVVKGASMDPTLKDRQYLLINRLTYRFTEPAQGDIIVFRTPTNPVDFIKRVVAVGGETVEIRRGQLYVDGQSVDEPYIVWGDDGYLPATLVPPGHLFVLGDNRMVSEDSRYFGFIPLSAVKGKAFLIFWPPQDFGVMAYGFW